jgi:hypothetical protein
MNKIIYLITTATWGRAALFGVWEDANGDRIRRIYHFSRHED